MKKFNNHSELVDTLKFLLGKETKTKKDLEVLEILNTVIGPLPKEKKIEQKLPSNSKTSIIIKF